MNHSVYESTQICNVADTYQDILKVQIPQSSLETAIDDYGSLIALRLIDRSPYQEEGKCTKTIRNWIGSR